MSNKKYGILLAGGKATRLYPITSFGISKQLLPVFNKPMIEFPLRTLQDLKVTDVLIINADEKQQSMFKEYLKDGTDFGMNFQYAIQESPKGIAEAFIIAEEFLKDANDVVLILGDNSFIGIDDFSKTKPNTIFTYRVNNPNAYGVVKLNEKGLLDKIVEKPQEFISDLAVVGLYYLSKTAVEIAKTLKPSSRGEIEITDVIRIINEIEGVKIQHIDSGFWFDCGTHDDLLECANLVKAIEKRTNRDLGLKRRTA